jgi:hypothetical protein
MRPAVLPSPFGESEDVATQPGAQDVAEEDMTAIATSLPVQA